MTMLILFAALWVPHLPSHVHGGFELHYTHILNHPIPESR